MTRTDSFTEDGRRYLFHNPRQKDPAYAYHFNRRQLVKIDHRGRVDAQFVQPHVTRYSLPLRCFYIRDNDTGKFWSAPFDPVQAEPGDFEFAPGISDTRWRNTTDGLEASLRLFLPKDDMAEIWTVTLRNVSRRTRDVSLYSYLPVGEICWMNHGGRFDAKLNGMVFKYFPYYAKVEDYYRLRDLMNCVCCLSDVRPSAYEISLNDFLGVGGEPRPDALGLPKLANGDGKTQACVAAFQYVRKLAPGASVTVNLLFGPAKDEAAIRRLKTRYMKAGGVEKALASVDRYFRSHEAAVQVDTPDADFNAFVNHWLCKQALYNGGSMRTTFYPGARNLFQDAMGLVYLDPKLSRHWFSKAYRVQHPDGFMPMSIKLDLEKCSTGSLQTGVGEIPHSDVNVWGPLTIAFYLTQTGDLSLLDEPVLFNDGQKSATIYEHVCLGLAWLLAHRSKRGLSLIGQGDWNDPLNMAGYKGKGESVWLTQALAYVLDLWAAVAEQRKDRARSRSYRKQAEFCRKVINRYAWDKAWYTRGFTDAGRPFGVARDKEGTMFINSQSWAILCGAASKDQTEAIIRSMNRHLMTPSGPMLLAPAFTRMVEDIGRLCIKNPGHHENGSVYCHASAFYSYALYQAGKPEPGYDMFRTLLPGWKGNTLERAGQIPLYIPNYYAGVGAGRRAGKSSHGYGTGTVAWFYRIMIECLFGLHSGFDGLRVDPQLPAAWDRASIRLPFRGAVYDVEIKRSRAARTTEVYLDGRKLADNLIPPPAKGGRHRVTVIVTASKANIKRT